MLLIDRDELISFCTYAEKDDIQPTDLTPWMGFVYTFPEHRGHHYAGLLMNEALKLAKADGMSEIYISTNHVGLYEKYGCEFKTEMTDMNGEPFRVYVKRIKELPETDRLILRPWRKSDAEVICGWIRNEEELYKWSADRFNKYPLTAEDIEANYAPQLADGRFYPLTAVDDEDNIIGHFIIRYPKPEDLTSVRFGFVIVDPEIRGRGYGRKMLTLGIRYAKDELKASRIDLGVFDNNDSARCCYESVGFRKYNDRECEMPIGTWKCIDMELFISSEITYKRLSEKELDTFIQMRIRQLREEGAKEDIDLVPALQDYYTRHMADGTFVSWLAMDGDKIVGTSGMSFVEKPPYFGCPSGKMGLLSSMFTDPDYRRKGIAKELLSRVVEEARAYGCGTVQITASDMGVLLYTDFGFVKNGNFMQYKL